MSVLQKMVRGKAMESIQLSEGKIRIGRSESSHLRLTPAAASKFHATIECLKSHCEVTDLNSRNGTFVNGIRINRCHRLRHGDTLDFAGATFVYLDSALESDDDSFSSSGSGLANPLKVVAPLPDSLDPEQSIRRRIVQVGDVVSCDDLAEFPGIDGPRVIAALDIHDLPLATWNPGDSTRSISHVLRLTKAMTAFHEHLRINEVLQVLLELFSAASHALIAIDDASVGGFRITAAVARQDGDGVFLCHPLVHRSVTNGEGLLVTDQTCQGVIQLQANDPCRPFSEPDLQRLAVLSHVLGAALPEFRHFA
jgi:hypothetical protein